MARHFETETRSGPRYLVSFGVRAEWDEPGGTHVMSEGTTENVGPEGTLVHLPRKLPDVGSRVRLEVQGEDGTKLQLVGETDEWRGLIWEPAAPRVAPPPPRVAGDDDEEFEGDEEEEDELAH